MTARACEIKLTPPHVVVSFGDSVSANCSTSSCSELVGMGWESSHGGQGLTHGVSSLPFHIAEVNVWDIYSQCYITLKNSDQKLEDLDITVYSKWLNGTILSRSYLFFFSYSLLLMFQFLFSFSFCCRNARECVHVSAR